MRLALLNSVILNCTAHLKINPTRFGAGVSKTVKGRPLEVPCQPAGRPMSQGA